MRYVFGVGWPFVNEYYQCIQFVIDSANRIRNNSSFHGMFTDRKPLPS